MTQPWWKDPSGKSRTRRTKGSAVAAPELLPAAKQDVIAELEKLIPGYTPEWSNRNAGDAGVALTRLYAELTSPIRARLNLLPDKMFTEYLRIGGVEPIGDLPASAMLVFELSPSADQAVVIPEGFQAGAQTSAGLTIFETEGTFSAVPLKIEDTFVSRGNIFGAIDTKSEWYPFGREAAMGRGLYVGMSGPVVAITSLSIGIDVAEAPGEPPPASAGGSNPLPVPPPPVMAWEVFVGGSFEPCEVVKDETAGLARSGIVELRVPQGWTTGVVPGLPADSRYWIRLRVVFGSFPAPPRLTALRLNAVRATAARTVRNEVLEAVGDLDRKQTRMRLSQSPVLTGSIVLEIDESGGINQLPAGAEATTSAPSNRWEEVTNLSQYGPDSQVFTLDAETGVLTFGNGVNGRELPPGFRHVRALEYRVASGSEGAVEAEKIGQMISSARFVVKVINPKAATGGVDKEARAATLRRGPLELRARSRAVTVADYELMALQAPGANIARAHAVSALHPQYPGSRIPGLVGVFLVPPDRGEGPPIADSDTLLAVAKYLAEKVAPAGVEVVTAATKFRRVRLEMSVVVERGYDTAETISGLIDAANTFLHPVTGGEDGFGWPFGGPLLYYVILQRLVEVKGVAAIPRLNLVIDGRRTAQCASYFTPADQLLWPVTHEVIPVEGDGA